MFTEGTKVISTEEIEIGFLEFIPKGTKGVIVEVHGGFFGTTYDVKFDDYKTVEELKSDSFYSID